MKIPDGSTVIVVSDSRSRTDKRCERERFYSTEFGGTGISPKQGSTALELGVVVHDAITRGIVERWEAVDAAKYAEQMAVKECEENLITGTDAFELPLLAGAMVYAFLSRVWPEYLKEYDLVIVEDACTWTGPDGIVWYARPDIMLRRKKDDSLWYLELKTTSLDPERFCRIWGRKSQIHLGPRCVEATTGEAVEGVIVQGIHKGSKYKGSSRSKLVGGYCREAIGRVGKNVWKPEHSSGFTWRVATEYDGGITAWIDQLPREIVGEYFPVTPPITPDPEYLDSFVRQRTHRELQIQAWRDNMDTLMESGQPNEIIEATYIEELDKVFPQNNEACENEMNGIKCSFYEICWNRMVGRDPLASGLFKQRRSPVDTLRTAMEQQKREEE